MQIDVPTHLNMYYESHLSFTYPENAKTLIFSQFIQGLEYFCLTLKLPIIELDFRKVTHFTSAASTVLFAHINHLQRISQTKFIFKFDKKSKIYEQLKLFEIAIKADSDEKLQALENKFHPWQSSCIPSEKISHIIDYFNQLRKEKLSQN